MPGGLIITPSRVDYARLTREDLVTVSDAGVVLAGTRLPSSELEVHRRVYLRRPDLNAILHTHSLHATALSCCHETIPVIVEEQAQVVGGDIPAPATSRRVSVRSWVRRRRRRSAPAMPC